MYPPPDHPLWYLPVFLFGACIGSFLNVVIYRVPLNLSVNDPKRSFCPICKSPIPMSRNVPLLSWLLLRGKCGDCSARIPFRYFAVELLTALLFLAVWWWLQQTLVTGPHWELAMAAAVPLFLMMALFVAITFIDAEHMIIPLALTWTGTAMGFLASALWPRLPDLAMWAQIRPVMEDGLKQAGLGWVTGFCGLWAVVLLGKLAFGRKKLEFPQPVAWRIREVVEEEAIYFDMGDEKIQWWDLFYRKSDRLVIGATSVKLNGETVEAGTVVVRQDRILLPDGQTVMVENLKSLEGEGTQAMVPREAMGMGDVHLLGMVGAFFGWSGAFFSLFGASLYAIFAALLGRIGFGRALPFGPFIILGAVTWMLGGWKLANWYFSRLGF